MACALTSGRTEPCKDSVGGLKTAYAIDFVEDSFTVVAGEATAINIAITSVFKYELNANGNLFNEPVTADNETGTTTYAQSLTLALKKQTKDSANEIHLLAKGRPIWVVKDRNGNHRVVGISDGTTLTGEIASGGAKTDFNGYTLTFVATEDEPAPYLDSATVTALEALISVTNITP